MNFSQMGGRIPDENHRLTDLSGPFRDTQGHQFQDFNDDVEVKDFTARLANLLSQAMRLRNQKLSLTEFETRAQEIKSQIELMTGEPQKHLGIQAIQDLFIRKKDRLYHWAKSPQIPAENNRAERELRPVVINRKVSFGSQSDAGALTRSSIMTLLFTVKKRVKDKSIEEWLKIALDEIALDKQKTFAKLLPPPLSPQ
ncbi:MAG: transposase [Bdellovibrionaceae bacterium]|nr:transposase [Pseudobdellovibrionaceae bacterium]